LFGPPTNHLSGHDLWVLSFAFLYLQPLISDFYDRCLAAPYISWATYFGYLQWQSTAAPVVCDIVVHGSYKTSSTVASTKYRRRGIYKTSSAKIPTRHRWPRLLHGIVCNENIVGCGIHQTSLATTFALIEDNFGRCSYKAPHIILQFYYCVDHQ
jgi:hypothetical protein